jgi:hypothetical protein
MSLRIFTVLQVRLMFPCFSDHQIVDPDPVPSAVAKERLTGRKASTYCVGFFPAGD